ncbi:MAG: DnrO protein [Xanthomonadaceae bacterium]|nr:DnrO protein [Xanthomonadaceae bacterium]
MHCKNLLPVTALALAGALFAAPVLAQSAAQHDHAAHAGHSASKKTPAKAPVKVPAQRWATDAPLRAGMRELREATELLNHYEMGHLDDTQRDNAVVQIDAAVKDMIANCKLKPDADAALHGLLVKFIAGANAARAGKFTKAELTPMQEALVQYPKQFQDPKWGQSGG